MPILWLTLVRIFKRVSETEYLAVPPTWSTLYNRVFSTDAQSVIVKVLQPLLLTEVVVTALSPEAYEAAPNLDSWLCDNRILRQGDVCTFTLDSLVNGSGVYNSIVPLQYRLDMLEPVIQGYARKGETKIILTLDIASQPEEADADNDAEGFEIGEDFLAPAMLGSSQGIINGIKPIAFECQALAESKSSSYEDCTLYLRTTDLGRVGGLNGDWVSLYCLGCCSR
jgi:peroxin-6